MSDTAMSGPPAALPAQDDPPPGPPDRPQAGLIVGLIERYALVALFVIAFIVFAFTASGFATSANVKVVLGTQAPLALFALAAMLPLVVGQFDLSVVAIGGASSIAVATAMSRFHEPLGVAIVIGVVFAALLGLINGLMVSRVGVNAFIATLAMSTVLQGAAQGYTHGTTINTGLSPHLTTASIGTLAGIPKGVLWFGPVAILMWYALEHTPPGRHFRAVGSNPGAARLLGLPVANLTAAAFVLSAIVSSCGGILLVGQSGLADPQTTLGALLLPALAAVFLGASAIQPGLFNVIGTLVAVFFVAYLVSGLSFLGASPWVQPVLDGGVLAGAVTVAAYLRRHRE